MRRALLAVLVPLLLSPSAPAAERSWLDRPLAPWNKAGDKVPKAPRHGDLSRCRAQVRPSAGSADRSLIAAGWSPFGALQVYAETVLITATSEVDGACRPVDYQAFVFVKGRFAGTLAPVTMTSRTDGSFTTFRLVSDKAVVAEAARYADGDPLCCPTRTSTRRRREPRSSSRASCWATSSTTASWRRDLRIPRFHFDFSSASCPGCSRPTPKNPSRIRRLRWPRA